MVAEWIECEDMKVKELIKMLNDICTDTPEVKEMYVTLSKDAEGSAVKYICGENDAPISIGKFNGREFDQESEHPNAICLWPQW